MIRTRCVALATLAACAREPSAEPCPTAIALAERAYLDCTDGLGLTVDSLAIDASGGIDVVFADDATAEQIDRALRECEPAMVQAFVLGRLACTSTDVGHPASADAIAAAVERAGADGFVGAVVVVRDGRSLWRGGVGLADREHAIASAPDVAYDCGSIMKMMTAAAIYQLEAEGMLASDDTLAELFDAVPPDKAAITIAQLVAHAAGFDEFHDTEGDFEAMDRDEALARIFAQELLFAPGTASAYSNSGYTLLAAIVEDASGLAFPQYLRTRLFEPAMMLDSGVYGDAVWSDAAVGYGEDDFGCNSPGCWPAPSWALMGNGGLVSTPADLARWSAAVEAGVPFDAATRDAWRRDVLSGGITIADTEVLAFSGRNDFGFGAAIAEVPARGTTVVVASNEAGSYESTLLLAQLLQMTLGELLEL